LPSFPDQDRGSDRLGQRKTAFAARRTSPIADCQTVIFRAVMPASAGHAAANESADAALRPDEGREEVRMKPRIPVAALAARLAVMSGTSVQQNWHGDRLPPRSLPTGR
jgi:hypothetical protein